MSFTGSSQVGARVAELGGRTLKRVSLELGGKNPIVIWEDADLDLALDIVKNLFPAAADMAFVSGNTGTAEAKFAAMRKAGVFIAESPATLGETLLIAAGQPSNGSATGGASSDFSRRRRRSDTRSGSAARCWAGRTS